MSHHAIPPCRCSHAGEAPTLCDGGGLAPTTVGCACPCHAVRHWTAECGYGDPATTAPVSTMASLTRELEHTRRAYDIARAAHATLERDWNAWRPLVPRLESDLATVTAERDALRAELAALRRYPVPPTPEVLETVAERARRSTEYDLRDEAFQRLARFETWVDAYTAVVAGDATDGVNVPTMEGV